MHGTGEKEKLNNSEGSREDNEDRDSETTSFARQERGKKRRVTEDGEREKTKD